MGITAEQGQRPKPNGTLNKDGQWVDPNGKLISDEITKDWDKGRGVKYPKHIRDQMAKPKRGRKAKQSGKTGD